MPRRQGAGRPTKMTPETIKKLEEAFALGCADREACLFADITPPTLYEYQKSNPDFITRKEILKENPILLARTSVVNGLKGDPDLALKYLERKKSDEFSTKQKQEVNVSLASEMYDEIDGSGETLPTESEFEE